MTVTTHAAPAWTALIPLVVIGLVILRNARARRLRVEQLWISPTILLAITALAFSQQHTPSPAMIALDVAMLAVGAAAGWWRGRFTRITIDPETQALTSQASPVGMLLILGIFAIRYVLRTYAQQSASLLHVDAIAITDAFMLLAVGIVCTQRLEMALRATRLLNEARATAR